MKLKNAKVKKNILNAAREKRLTSKEWTAGFLFKPVLGLPCYMGFSLVATTGGYSSLQHTDSLLWLLLLQSTGSKVCRARLSSCGTKAELLRSTWDLPIPGIKPMSPSLADVLFTTEPQRKSDSWIFNCQFGNNKTWKTVETVSSMCREKIILELYTQQKKFKNEGEKKTFSDNQKLSLPSVGPH